jgi:hypothetical protein
MQWLCIISCICGEHSVMMMATAAAAAAVVVVVGVGGRASEQLR